LRQVDEPAFKFGRRWIADEVVPKPSDLSEPISSHKRHAISISHATSTGTVAWPPMRYAIYPKSCVRRRVRWGARPALSQRAAVDVVFVLIAFLAEQLVVTGLGVTDDLCRHRFVLCSSRALAGTAPGVGRLVTQNAAATT
jgi:hypothetical protein